VDYGTDPISDPIPVVNPAYRRLDGQVRSAAGKLSRLLAQFGAMNLEQPIEPEHVEPFLQRKAALQEEIDALQTELQTLANASSDAAIRKLCEELNATETVFPRTNLRLVCKLGSS
jgi:hypothetical protein